MPNVYAIVKSARELEIESNNIESNSIESITVDIFDEILAYIFEHKTCRATITRKSEHLVENPGDIDQIVDLQKTIESRLKVMLEKKDNRVVIQSFYMRYTCLEEIKISIALSPKKSKTPKTTFRFGGFRDFLKALINFA